MKSVDALLGIAKAIAGRAGAALTGILAFPGVIDMPTPLRAAVASAAAWFTGSAVWLAKNRTTIDADVAKAVDLLRTVNPGLLAKVQAEDTALAVQLGPLQVWADSIDVQPFPDVESEAAPPDITG